MTNPDWNFNNLESLIQHRGDNVIHETGISCTCRKQDVYGSGIMIDNKPATQRRLYCEQCGGSGWFYRGAKVLKGLVTSVESGRNRQLLDSGYAVPGDAVFSPSLRAPALGDFDRITFCYPAPISDGQTILRNAANISDNAMLSLGLSTVEDRLWYNPACVIWCEDQDGIVYTEGVDFTLAEKKITWGSTRPADGKFYTLKYQAYLEWIVYATPMTRFDVNRTLGQRVLLRKLHVAAQNDYEFDTVSKRNEQETTFTTKTTI